MDPTLINLKFIGLKYNDNESSEWMSQKINRRRTLDKSQKLI